MPERDGTLAAPARPRARAERGAADPGAPDELALLRLMLACAEALDAPASARGDADARIA